MNFVKRLFFQSFWIALKNLFDFSSFFLLFLIFIAHKKTCPSKEEASEAFSVFDINGNGYIPLKELQHVLKSLGEGLEDDILAKIAQLSEPDSDQQV